MRRRVFAPIIAAALFLVAIAFLPVEMWIAVLRDWAATHGYLGWAVFALGYATLTFLLVPGALLMLAAGVAFGLDGFFPVLGGAMLSSCFGFLGGRYFARARVQRLIAGKPRLAAIDDAVEREGWRIVLLLRLSGLIPFNLQNWALGATRVRFGPYLLATLFGVMPGALTYVWAGSLGGVAGEDAGARTWILLAVGVVATGAMIILISRKAQKILRKYGVQDNGPA